LDIPTITVAAPKPAAEARHRASGAEEPKQDQEDSQARQSQDAGPGPSRADATDKAERAAKAAKADKKDSDEQADEAKSSWVESGDDDTKDSKSAKDEAKSAKEGKDKESKSAKSGKSGKSAKAEAAAKADALGSAVLEVASRYVGVPYRYGGNTPRGFDCSGFTQYVFGQLGVDLPHQSESQKSRGRVVSRSEARPGDLIWVPGHVAIYVGGNKMIDSARAGTTVQVRRMWQSNPTFIRLVG
jgi:cell wall-associated NlpC family hydrolase